MVISKVLVDLCHRGIIVTQPLRAVQHCTKCKTNDIDVKVTVAGNYNSRINQKACIAVIGLCSHKQCLELIQEAKFSSRVDLHKLYF